MYVEQCKIDLDSVIIGQEMVLSFGQREVTPDHKPQTLVLPILTPSNH